MSAESEPYTREALIALCEDAIVPMEKWHDRDSASAHEQIGIAWALLRAGSPFSVLRGPKESRGLVTDDTTVWVRIRYRGFNQFEYGSDGEPDTHLAYLPTAERLARRANGDWY